MALRNNAYGRLKKDAYGSSSQPNKPTMIGNNLNQNANVLRPRVGNPTVTKDSIYTKNASTNKVIKDEQDAANKAMEVTEKNNAAYQKSLLGQQVSASDSFAKNGAQAVGSYGSNSKGTAAASAGKVDAASAASSAGVMAAGMAADSYKGKGKEDAQGALSGAASGAAMGASAASVVPGVGTVVGAVVGGIVGGVVGYSSGKKKMKQRKKGQEAAKQELIKQKALRAKKQAEADGKVNMNNWGADEQARGMGLREEANKLDQYGRRIFKKGGLMYTIEKEEVTPVEEKIVKSNRRITEKFSKGGEFRDTKKKMVFKLPDDTTPLFRRGGKVNVNKKNVIVNGPSHEDKNNTSVNNDRGLPIVKKGEKVAEIESKELIINKDSISEVEGLIRKTKTDPKAKEKLGELLEHELKNNTYDYSDLLD